MRYLWYSIYIFVGSLAVYSLFFQPAQRGPEPVARPVSTPVATREPALKSTSTEVQIAILLDTSSSMDGLIQQARTQLWDIVSELQTDDRDRPRSVSVALYQYGNSRLERADGFIERLSPLTGELDAVSVRLHALSTSGGKEYAPTAILRATEELDWSDDDSVEKVIVIAGNEGFNQGQVSVDTAMQAAAAKGIKIVPIFCANGGATSTGLASWKRASQLAKAELDTIDPDKVVAELETPFDAKIVEKYRELQATRLTYGDQDYQKEVESVSAEAERYVTQQSMSVQASRAVAQSRQGYQQDLTADYGKAVNLERLNPSQLPSPLRGLSKAEQVHLIQQNKAKRSKLESEIKGLQKERAAAQSSMYGENASMAAPSLGGTVRSKLR